MKNSNQYYVCIGASAGGLEALESFFTAMPNNTGFIFIVIQHLSPDYKSLMSELLARHTDMMIQVITDGMETHTNQLYLIPPRKNLTIFHGKLYLEEQNNTGHVNLPVDVFMKSLAEDQNKNAIGIILSGTGSDGTRGVRAIKEAGGMVMVQKESTAKFDGMPKSSIATGLVDYILPPEKMPEALMNFVQHPNIKSLLNRALDDDEENIDDLTKISLIMREYCGVDFSYYKENTILRRLDRRVKINRLDNLQEYITILRDSVEEKEILQREFFIGVTSFFRDAEAFESLKMHVVPNIDYSKGIVRIWSAGCSTGEEVYSLAILFREYLEKKRIECTVKLFATDVDARAIEIAGTGYYSESVMAEVDIDLVEKYFIKKDDGYQVSDAIRKMVVFAKHNILKDPPFSKLDLLVCRNLFIYIKSEQQKRIMASFYVSLKSKGYMFIGNSETIGDLGGAFSTIDPKWKIFKCREGYLPHLANEISYSSLSRLPQVERRFDSKANQLNLRTEQLLSSIVSEISPPAIVIDENDNIVQIINDVSGVVTMQPGKFSNDFSSNMSREASLFVNNIIRRLKAETSEVVFSNILLNEGGLGVYTITGRNIESNKRNFYMISFIKKEEIEKKEQLVEIDVSEEVRMRVKNLENELQMAQEGLQATIEELESSNEELQSSNEELIASNEELQSTNEELQSVNEELYTVNNEFQSKIEELSSLTNDLNNLMRNTEVGALYLDDRLCIRRLSPIVSSITNILTSDIGRSVKHITVMENYQTIIDDIETVSERLVSLEKEICDKNGEYWLIRLRPYRTEFNAVAGIIITFVNIDKLKKKQSEYNLVNEHLNRALSIGHMAYWTYDVETGHLEFSNNNAKMLGYRESEFPTDIQDRNKLIHNEDRARVERVISECLNGHNASFDITYRILRKDGDYSLHYDHGIISSYDSENKARTMVGIISDITEIVLDK